MCKECHLPEDLMPVQCDCECNPKKKGVYFCNVCGHWVNLGKKIPKYRRAM